MTSIRTRVVLATVAVAALVVLACSFAPLSIFGFGDDRAEPPITLKRCDDAQDVLCVLSFGVEPPDQMLVTLRTAPGLPTGLEVLITYRDEKQRYECKPTELDPTLLYCVGPQIPLGTTMLIQVRATEEDMLLASGEFTLMALALPTVSGEGVGFPTPGNSLLPRVTQTMFTIIGPSTPTAKFAPQGTPTSSPAPGYPNPTPRSSPTPGPAPTQGPNPNSPP